MKSSETGNGSLARSYDSIVAVRVVVIVDDSSGGKPTATFQTLFPPTLTTLSNKIITIISGVKIHSCQYMYTYACIYVYICIYVFMNVYYINVDSIDISLPIFVSPSYTFCIYT